MSQCAAVRAELPWVAIGRGVQQQHLAPGGHGGAVEVDRPGGGAGEPLHGTGQPEELLDRSRDPSRVLEQQRTLVTVLGQQLRGHAEQPRGGVVAPGHHGEREAEHRQRSDLGPLALGAHQLGDHVVTDECPPVLFRVSAPNQVVEVPEQLRQPLGRTTDVAARVGLDDGLGPHVEARPVVGRDPQVVGDHHAGQGLEQLGHDVAAALGGELVESLHDEAAHLRLDLGDLSGGEPAGHQPPERGVLRWVGHHDRRGVGESDPFTLPVGDGEPVRRRERGGVAAASQTSPKRESTQ